MGNAGNFTDAGCGTSGVSGNSGCGTSEVVTVMEVLSPTNKRPGEGRRTYEAKRQTVLASPTNLVEIDLLWQWPPIVQLPEQIRTHYRILVRASVSRPRASLYGFNLQEPIRRFLYRYEKGNRNRLLTYRGCLVIFMISQDMTW